MPEDEDGLRWFGGPGPAVTAWIKINTKKDALDRMFYWEPRAGHWVRLDGDAEAYRRLNELLEEFKKTS